MAQRKVRHSSLLFMRPDGGLSMAYRGAVVDLMAADIPALEAAGAVVSTATDVPVSGPIPPTVEYPLGGGGSATTLPAGGEAGQALVKQSADDGDVAWEDVAPEALSYARILHGGDINYPRPAVDYADWIGIVVPENIAYGDILYLQVAPPDEFNPLTQVTPLHSMWAEDPDWAAPADGDPVSSWRNASGAGDPAATGTNRPIYRESVAGLNGKPGVEFTAASSHYLDFDIVNVVQPYKWVLVKYQSAITNSKNLIGTGGSAAGAGIGTTGAGLLYVGSSATILTMGAATTGARVIRATINDTSSSAWRDEGAPVAGAAGNVSHQRLTLGAGNTSGAISRHADVTIAFFGLYPGSTPDADLAQLAADLITHYAIA